MRKSLAVVILAVLSQTLAAPEPQLISLGKNGEVGVNFGGYHASAGLGGLLSGGGVGGLHAEAGTPHGQAARAGLGGSFSQGGETQGGLYAGATAGGGTQAAAGLEGRAGAGGAAGAAYSGAQAGGSGASAGLGGDSSSSGTAGFAFSAHKSFNSGGTVAKEVVDAPPVLDNTVLPEHNLEVVKHKKKVVSYENSVNVQATPAVYKKTVEFQAAPAVAVEKNIDVRTEVQTPVIYKEVRVHRPRVHYKPRHHYKHWGGANGYFEAGIGAQAAPSPPEATKVVYKEVQVPAIDKRIDAASASSVDAGVAVQPAEIGYTKTVKIAQRNPNFFADIFNIPIQTLSAVSKLLGNAASGTSVSVEKSSYAHAG